MRVHVGATVGAVVAVHVGTTVGVDVDVHVDVDVPDVLSIALRHLDDFGTDFDELPAPLLRGTTAALANRERDLVARAPGVPVAVEGLPAKQQEGCVFVERLARIPTNLRHRFAEGRENVTRELEPEHVAL
jgi:hypothetical protein